MQIASMYSQGPLPVVHISLLSASQLVNHKDYYLSPEHSS